MGQQTRVGGLEHPERKFTLIAARIHATQGMKDEPVNDDELVANLLHAIQEVKGARQEGTGRTEASVWVLGDARQKTIGSDRIVFGRMGRLRPGFDIDTFDSDHHVFKTSPVETQTATGIVNFLVDIASRSIIYEERLPIISDKQFRTYFKLLYMTQTENFQNISITPLSSTEELYKWIAGLDILTWISAKVTPSNPEVSKDFRGFDDLLRKAAAVEATVKLSNPQGLKTEKTLVSEAIALAAAGYGDVTLRGERNSEAFSMRSSKEIVREEIGKHRDSPEELIELFHSRLKAIIQRIVK